MNLRWIAVVVDDRLPAETRVVVLRVELQHLTPHGDVERRTQSVVPCALLVERVDDELAAAGHEVVALGEGVHRAEALTGRGAQAPDVVDLPLHVEARGDEGAVERAVVDAQAGHGDEAVVEVVGVLRIAAHHVLLLVHALPEVGLAEVVVVERRAEGDVVVVGDIGLEHQLRVEVLLVDVVSLAAVGGVHLMHRGRGHPGDVGAVGGVEDEGMLHVTLVAMGVEVDAVDGISLMVEHTAVVGLTALALLVEQGQSAVEDVVARLAIPAVLQVELPRLRVVHETVVVAVVLLEVILIVAEELGAEAFGEVDIAVGVGLDATHGVAVEVDVHGLVVLGLEVLHIDLPGHGLVAVLHAGVALAHLDALHPGSGNVA